MQKILSLALLTTSAVASHQTQGDGIFTPIVSQVAPIDKTGRPMTLEIHRPAPSFVRVIRKVEPTGDNFTIHFPTGDLGGECFYSDSVRYVIDYGGELTYQILADCGKLRRAYSYHVCRLNENLRCSEPPWWFFKDSKFSISNEGLVVDGSPVYRWKDSEAPQQLEAVVGKIKLLRAQVVSHTVSHGSRTISCRSYRPEARGYDVHEFVTPGLASLRDGDPIDWNSSVGTYVKQQNSITDVSNWACWVRTQ
jgi:hypothetical protein